MSSRRNYLDQTELVEYAEINITDANEADDRISKAEELIDMYVGPQKQHVPRQAWDIQGLVSAVADSTHFTLEARHQNVWQEDFFTYCWVEIIGGTGAGQRARIIGSLYTGEITIDSKNAFSPLIDTTSFYRIWQLGHFPRQIDVYFDAIHNPIRYHKHIPEEIRRAVAAQVEYMIEQGDDFFASDDVYKNAEYMGSYRYQKDRQGSGTGIDQLISPKAKWMLRGFKNRKGVMLV